MVKKVFFIFSSMALLVDCLLLPFLTEPFVFNQGINKEYVFGVIIVVLVWVGFIRISFVGVKNVKLWKPDGIFISSQRDIDSYYFHLRNSFLIAIVVITGFIFFSLFVIVSQMEIIEKNLRFFF